MKKRGHIAGAVPFIPGILCILLLTALLALGFVFFDSMERETTDPGEYQRVLRQNGYPGDPLLAQFPAGIPEGAEELEFHFLSTLVGKTFALRCKLTDEEIAAYERRYAQSALWSGPEGAGAEAYGIFEGTMDVFDEGEEAPEDLTLYLLYWQADGAQNSLNHGQHCVAAISRTERNILFFANKW